MAKILFISHNAGRNGAPIMLLNMLRWFRENSSLRFEVLLRSSGELRGEFEALCPTYLYRLPETPVTYMIRRLGLGKVVDRIHYARLLSRLRSAGFDLIYSNTITNGDILTTLAFLGHPVITHVHELEGWIEKAGPENLRQVRENTARYIAASDAARQNLVERHGIPAETIDTVYSFVPLPERDHAAMSREELGIPEDAFVVLGSGREFWCKGKDLFVQLAARVKARTGQRPVHFLWVGGWADAQDEEEIIKAADRLGVQENIHFVGQVDNPLDYFAAGDIFALVSREDTFPLVCLEAAALGKPIVCFAETGGMPNFVEGEAGYVVPHLDLDAMADKVAALADDGDLRASLGKRASEKVRERYDLEGGCRHIEQIIRDLLDAKSR